MKISQSIRDLTHRLDERLFDIIDSVIRAPFTGPVSPELLNPLLGVVLGRLDVYCDERQSAEPMGMAEYLHWTTMRSAILLLLNNPLLYAYTSAIIFISYYIWKEEHERNSNEQGGRREKEAGDIVPQTGASSTSRSPQKIRGNKNI